MPRLSPRFILASLGAAFVASSALAQTAYSGHGAESVSAATLEQFRPKPLPADISRRIQSVLDLRAPGSGLLSPDGKHLYFSWRVSGSDQVWRLDGPDRFPLQMTGGEDRTLPLAVTPDSKWLVVSRDRKGEENPGIYLQPVAGGTLKAVQHLPKVQTRFAFVSDDSRFIYFSANDQKPDSYAIYRYEIATGAKTTVFDQPGLWDIADHASDGRLLLVKETGSQSREYSLLDRDGALKPLLGQGEQESYEAKFGHAPGELLVSTTKFSDFRRLYRWKAGKFEPLTGALKWNVEAFGTDDARRRLYYTVNEAGYSRSHALDLVSGKPLSLPWPAGADHQNIGSQTYDGRYVVLSVGTAKAPRQSLVWDWKTRKLTRWVTPSTPEEDTTRYAAAKLESYPARDGTPIPMFVRRPAQCEGADAPVCPVLVHFHGGPEAQSRPGFSPLWQMFVDAGFIVVDPNVRGSDGYGRAWLDADNGPRRLDVITDIEDASIYIRKAWAKNGVVPKVGVFGGSYGGYSTLIAMTMFAGAYDAGASAVGIANLNTFLKNTAPYRRALRISEYGDPERDHDALVKLSATSYIDRLKAPLLISQGASDPRVPVGEALQMYEAAKARGTPVELMIFADEGHGTSRRENQALEWGHILRFFQQHLLAH
ncbi:S9 family peptidase [Niveibacterium umoris]|uniref:Dipeptidyl aminopeptidase/acylaminoacyl peptidase n=1 Tax=Niveibacterium umoris TaxID=1193620 RepID=A0A840BJK0_9RHOO|nr:prolyl oligopeptidase family serine peptidase [Niveibacterium umoris]MBB4013711.1 dipeptidyl aminopeptidase/acylaminoacyl peptidase [Niveibacterium umoris]